MSRMKTIAIIDVDIHIGDILADVLTREGYSVLRAYSGTEALYTIQCQQLCSPLLIRAG